MYDQILLPYDGTDEAKKGAKHGIQLASALDARVHALYVIDLPAPPHLFSLPEEGKDLEEEYREHADGVLEELCRIAEENGVDCERAIRTGTVSDEIVEYAEEERMDAIVMGSAYRGKLGNILGGTTDKVVRSATIPVITQRMERSEL